MVSLVVQQSLGFLVVAHVIKDIWRLILSGLIMYAILVFALPLTGWLYGMDTGFSLISRVALGVLSYFSVLGLLFWMTGRDGGPERIIWDYITTRFVRSSMSR